MQLLEYVSRAELEQRWERVRRLMECDALIVLQNVDEDLSVEGMFKGVPARRPKN